MLTSVKDGGIVQILRSAKFKNGDQTSLRSHIKPQNLPEKLIWYYITWNYLIYLMGAQFILAPLMAWFLLGYLLIKWWLQDEDTPLSEQIHLSTASLIGCGAMLIVAATFLIGSLDFEENYYVIARNFFNGWVRMWSLLVIFPLIGHLNIRPQIIFRAVSIFCSQSLALVILFWMIAFATDGAAFHYVSPLYKFGGLLNYYTVIVGNLVDVNEWRLQMIAPWAPAMGLVGNVYFFLAMQETDKKWRYLGMAGAVVTILSTFSRTAIIGLPLVYIFGFFVDRVRNPITFFSTGISAFFAAIFIDPILDIIREFISTFKKFRQGSTTARQDLQFLAVEAWKRDAPIWGHGSFSKYGSEFTGGHSIASDNTLYGVLFQLGIVGGLSLAVAFLSVFLELIYKNMTHRYTRTGLELLGVFSVFLLTENLEASAYLYWPGLVMLGILLRRESVLKNYSFLKSEE
jgi:O-Antigen ligase